MKIAHRAVYIQRLWLEEKRRTRNSAQKCIQYLYLLDTHIAKAFNYVTRYPKLRKKHSNKFINFWPFFVLWCSKQLNKRGFSRVFKQTGGWHLRITWGQEVWYTSLNSLQLANSMVTLGFPQWEKVPLKIPVLFIPINSICFNGEKSHKFMGKMYEENLWEKIKD